MGETPNITEPMLNAIALISAQVGAIGGNMSAEECVAITRSISPNADDEFAILLSAVASLGAGILGQLAKSNQIRGLALDTPEAILQHYSTQLQSSTTRP